MPDQDQGGLFARSGKDSVRIFGRKVPIAFLAAVVALLGVVLVLRARSKGQNVASAGQAPVTGPITAADTGFGISTQPDISGALANITEQLTSLRQGAAAPPATMPNLNATIRQGTGPGDALAVSSTPGGPITSWIRTGGRVQVIGTAPGAPNAPGGSFELQTPTGPVWLANAVDPKYGPNLVIDTSTQLAG